MDHSAGERMAKSAWGLFFVFVIILGIVTGCGEGMDQAAGDKGLSSGPAGINATFEKILKRSSSFASQVLRPTFEDARLKTLELGNQDKPIDLKQAEALLLAHRDQLGLSRTFMDPTLKSIHTDEGLHIFQATFEGKPILGSQIAVHQDSERVWAENHLVLLRFKKPGCWDDVSHEELTRLAMQTAGVKRLRMLEKDPVRISQMWMDRKGTLVPIYRVVLFAAEPAGDIEIILQSRKILGFREISRQAVSLGGGKVFIGSTYEITEVTGNLAKDDGTNRTVGSFANPIGGGTTYCDPTAMAYISCSYPLALMTDSIHGRIACDESDCTLTMNSILNKYALLNNIITFNHSLWKDYPLTVLAGGYACFGGDVNYNGNSLCSSSIEPGRWKTSTFGSLYQYTSYNVDSFAFDGQQAIRGAFYSSEAKKIYLGLVRDDAAARSVTFSVDGVNITTPEGLWFSSDGEVAAHERGHYLLDKNRPGISSLEGS